MTCSSIRNELNTSKTWRHFVLHNLLYDPVTKGICDDDINWEKIAFSSEPINLLQYHQIERKIKDSNHPSNKNFFAIFAKITTKQTEEISQKYIQPVTLVADVNSIKPLTSKHSLKMDAFTITLRHVSKQNVLYW